MASTRFLQYGALAIVVLAAMIMTTPFSNAQTVDDNTRVEEMRLLITWGDIDNTLGTVGSGETLEWDGEVTVQQGTMTVLRPLMFKDENDRLLNRSGNVISFQSDINSDLDGLFLRILPKGGQSDTVTFTLDEGFSVTRPLITFLEEPEVTFAVHDGLSVRMKAEAIISRRGELRTQIAARINAMLQTCRDQGEAAATCEAKRDELQKTIERQGRRVIWEALNRQLVKLYDEVWADASVHPDVLFLLTQEQLDALTLEDLARMDLSKVSHMTDMVFAALERIAPERIRELPTPVQEELHILQGTLPADIQNVARLTDQELVDFQRFLAELDAPERIRFVQWLATLTSKDWDLLKTMDKETVLALGRIALSAPEAKRDAVMTAYVRQAVKLQNLHTKLDQVRSKLSLTDARTIEEMLTRLENTVLWTGDDTPTILTEIDSFLARSAALQRDAFARELRLLESNEQQSLAENSVGIIKEQLGLFRDVPVRSWYAGFVGMMRSEGYLEGYKDAQGNLTGSYGPSNPVTVAELLKIAMTTTGNGAGSGTVMLPGAQGHWSSRYVARAEELNITLVKNTSLDLNRPATRAEVIQTFIEAYGINPAVVDSIVFKDVFPSMAAARFIAFAQTHGIVSGDDGENTFRPTAPVNRAEVAKIAIQVRRFLGTLFQTTTIEGDLEG